MAIIECPGVFFCLLATLFHSTLSLKCVSNGGWNIRHGLENGWVHPRTKILLWIFAASAVAAAAVVAAACCQHRKKAGKTTGFDLLNGGFIEGQFCHCSWSIKKWLFLIFVLFCSGYTWRDFVLKLGALCHTFNLYSTIRFTYGYIHRLMVEDPSHCQSRAAVPVVRPLLPRRRRRRRRAAADKSDLWGLHFILNSFRYAFPQLSPPPLFLPYICVFMFGLNLIVLNSTPFSPQYGAQILSRTAGTLLQWTSTNWICITTHWCMKMLTA